MEFTVEERDTEKYSTNWTMVSVEIDKETRCGGRNKVGRAGHSGHSALRALGSLLRRGTGLGGAE